MEDKPGILILDSDDEAMMIAERVAEIRGADKVDIVGNGNTSDNYKYALDRAIAMSSLASSLGFGLFPSIGSRFREKPKSKCLLSGCENMTAHNKGYCSAECFKKSRQKETRLSPGERKEV